jgi:hypothetical protein
LSFNSGTLDNLSGGVYDVQGDATFNRQYWGSTGTVNNAGTFRSSIGAGTVTLDNGVAMNIEKREHRNRSQHFRNQHDALR